MKQWLCVLLFVASALHTVSAQINSYHVRRGSTYVEETWCVIWSSLFNGENSKVFRFEDDIRLQVIGDEIHQDSVVSVQLTHQDSAVFVQLVGDLNNLLETVQVNLVTSAPNFTIKLYKNADWIQKSSKIDDSFFIDSCASIKNVEIIIYIKGATIDKETANKIYCHTISKLTKVFRAQFGTWPSQGIFDASNPDKTVFTDLDKNLLKKLYSHDFYKNLKENVVKLNGYLFYYDLRYRKLLKNLSYTFKVLLLLFGFIFFLSRESKRNKNPNLLQYIKQRALILLLIPFFFISFDWLYPLGIIDLMAVFIPSSLFMIAQGFLVLVLLYYIEPIFLKKISTVIGKQAFLFVSTMCAALLIPTVMMIFDGLKHDFYILHNALVLFYWVENPNLLYQIAFLAALRIFYNLIQFRIQSMVNQKDVELAKMKELKNQAELNALHARINPHFLYNSLNSIASLAHMDADKTEHMALGLSELFRYSINKENKTYVSVDEELSMVNKYLDIEKTRFGDRLDYEIKVDEGARELQIPKFLIQPLVENAVKHGISTMKDKGRIVVKVGDRVVFVRLDEVSYLQADEKYVTVVTKHAKSYILDSSLKKLEEKLPAYFIRVHKSFLINRNLLKEVNKHFNNRFVLVLDDYSQTRITSGRSYYQTIRELLEY